MTKQPATHLVWVESNGRRCPQLLYADGPKPYIDSGIRSNVVGEPITLKAGEGLLSLHEVAALYPLPPKPVEAKRAL